MFSEHDEIILGAFQQIEESILLLQQWNANVMSEDDYLYSPEGMKNLAATCMLIEAISNGKKQTESIIGCRSLFHKLFAKIVEDYLIPLRFKAC